MQNPWINKSCIAATLLTLLIATLALPAPALADSVITVATTIDDLNDADGLCSLREAITNANADAQTYDDCVIGSGNDTIQFNDALGTSTITLGSTLPTITDSLTINGGGDITISGNTLYRIFFIDASITSFTLQNVTVADGHCASCAGGGVSVGGGGTPTITVTNSTLSNNAGTNGGSGGIYMASGDLIITTSTFSGNTTDGGCGGAVSIGDAASELTLTNSTFLGNTSTNFGAGGGICNAGIMNIANSTFTNNAGSNSGGAISNTGTGTITNSTFTSNGNTNMGGAAIYNQGTMTVTNSTFSNNTGGGSPGGDIYQLGISSVLSLYNNILANHSGVGPICEIQAGTASGNNNLIEDVSPQCGITNGIDANIISAASDPNLGALTGSPAYFPLNSGSPAIDAGDDATCISPDQRGVIRPQNGVCDIGAVEVDPTPPTVVSSLRAGVTPTSAAAVDFIVTFSENVKGVDPTDFTPIMGGVSGATVSGVIGSGDTYTVTVNTGTGNGTLGLDVFDDDTIKDLADNLLYGGLTGGELYTILKTATAFKSIGTNDGWVLESTETSKVGGAIDSIATYLRAGDEIGDRQYRSILHFDTHLLPDSATIISVQVKIKKLGFVGSSPFGFPANLLVDIKKPSYGTALLQATDFQTTGGTSAAGLFSSVPVSNWYTATFTSGLANVNKTGTTQLRLRFSKDDNDDNGADYLKFYSGNAGAAYRPVLNVYYYIP